MTRHQQLKQSRRLLYFSQNGRQPWLIALVASAAFATVAGCSNDGPTQATPMEGDRSQTSDPVLPGTDNPGTDNPDTTNANEETPSESPVVLPSGRLLVSDAEEAKVYVVDLDERTVIETIDVAYASSFLTNDPSGRFVWLSHYFDDGGFEVIDGGIVYEPHDDHFHLDTDAPKLLDRAFPGPQPTHVVHHDGIFAFYFDGEAKAGLLPESSLITGIITEPTWVFSTPPHHGVALPTHGHVIITRSSRMATDEEQQEGWLGGIPTGVSIRTLDNPNDETQSFDGCTKLHGEAVHGDHVAFGCDEGVLLLTYGESDFSGEMIAPPAGSLARAYTVLAHPDASVFVTDFGPALGVVDPSAKTMNVQLLPDAANGAGFAFLSDGTDTRVVVMGSNGKLYRLTPTTLAPEGDAMDVATAADRFLLTVGGGRISVATPGSTELVVIDAESWEIAGTVTLPGTPASIAHVGAPPDGVVLGHN